MKAGSLIPVLGPECTTFGPDDTPLYPWLAEQLVERLQIVLPKRVRTTRVRRPLDLRTVASAYLAGHRSITDFSCELDALLNSSDLVPGPLLHDLARVRAFTHFLTLGFDPLLERALADVRYRSLTRPRIWTFSLGEPAEDLPFGMKDAPHTLLGYLFGRVSPNGGFHIWDHDAIEFIWQLQRMLPSLNTLASTLAGNNLLILGTDFSDWLVRFFLRVIKAQPLKQDSRFPFLLAGKHLGADGEAVLFYDALDGRVEIVSDSPIAFAREFLTHALAVSQPVDRANASPRPFSYDREVPFGAIFVSYCHTDRDLAFRVAEKLQRSGCVVWLDRDRLTAGDNFENQLEDAVRRNCGLFLSLITSTTESRLEGYFHKERRWAAERHKQFAPTDSFCFPLASEDAPRPPRREPRVFADLHVDIATGGEIPDGLCERLRTLQQSRFAPQ